MKLFKLLAAHFRRLATTPPPREEEQLWSTCDGPDIRICDMTTRHLEKTISLLQQSDSAEMCTDDDLTPFDSDFAPHNGRRHPLYDSMCRELARRQDALNSRLDSLPEDV